jgi:hypothetical protein
LQEFKLISTGSRKSGGALTVWCAGALFTLIVLAVLFPALALFSWHSEGSEPSHSNPGAQEVFLPLAPRVSRSCTGDWREIIRPVANPIFSALNGRDPFAARAEALLAPDDNPFAAALAAGISEGRLVVKGRLGGIPVLGPDAARRLRYSDPDVLRELQAGVGGAFGDFLKKTFDRDELAALAAEGEADENPFRKSEPEEAKTETPSTEAKAEKPEDTQPDEKPAEQEKPADAPPANRAPAANFPDLLLRVAEDGTLQAVPANHPAEGVRTSKASSGTYQVSDQGSVEFNIFPFTDPADFPMSMAVSDLNNDGAPDIVIHSSMSGMLHFFAGEPDGGYSEVMRVQAGKQQMSLTAGDFNRDGISDLAMSNIGAGAVTVLFASASNSYNFRSFWVEPYRDYISATDTEGTGTPDVLGLSFANRGSVLLDFRQPEGIAAGRDFDYLPALTSQIATRPGQTFRLNAVMLASTLSINVDNRSGHLTNVLSVAPGLPVSILIGNLNNKGNLVLGILTPKK